MIVLLALLAQNSTATPLITSVVESGGLLDTNDTVTAKWTGVSWTDHANNEPVNGLLTGQPYTVGLFQNWAPCYVDRNHRHTNASSTVPIPSYLLGGEYIMSGNDDRAQPAYTLDVTVGAPVDVYLLIDNRLGDANNNDPPTFDATHMLWVVTNGWAPVKTGVNRALNISLPDETGIDEIADGTINNNFSVYKKSFPAGTFRLKQADNAGNNMYAAVVVPVPGQFTATSFIGYSGAAGSAVTNAVDSYTVFGGGNDVWDQLDEFTYLWREISGDFDVKVRVESLEAAATWTKAGLMARESLTPSSRMIWERVTPRPASDCAGGGNGANDIKLSYRRGPNRADGQHEDGNGSPAYPNAWIRLQRQGDVISGYYGTDGTNWTQSGTQDTASWPAASPSWPGGALNKKLYLGLAVSRHSGSCLTARAEFRDYMLVYGTFGGPFAVHSASSLGCPSQVRVRFTRPVGLGALDPANYDLSGGLFVTSVSAGPTPDTVNLSVDNPFSEGASYAVFVTNVQDAQGSPLNPNPSSASFVHAEGYELRNIHLAGFKIGGASLANLTASAAYKLDSPDSRSGNSLFEDTHPDTGNQEDENYSARIIGVVNVNNNGNYTFACSSDDLGQLYLSGDDQPANKVLIAREPEWNGQRAYATGDRRTTYPQYFNCGNQRPNQSCPQALATGSRHYLEFIYAEGGGGNNGSAAWDAGSGAPFFDGQNPMEISDFIPSRFAYGSIFYTLGAAFVTRPPSDAIVSQGLTTTFTVVLDGTPPYRIQWTRNGTPIPGANGQSYTIPPATAADNGAVYRAAVTNDWGGELSGPATLTVLLNPKALSASSRGNCHRVYVTFNKPVQLDGTYSLSGGIGVNNVAYGQTHAVVCLAVSPDLVADTNYSLLISDVHSEGDNLLLDPNPTTLSFAHGAEYPSFRLLYKFYNSVGNGNLAALLSSAKFINDQPDQVLLDPTGFFEVPTNVGDNYGAKLLGFYIAPVEGDYRFWMSSDDQGATYLAPDAVPAHKQIICYEPFWGGVRGWMEAGHDNNDGRYTSTPVPGGVLPVNSSAPFHLLAGQKVYLEGVFSEGGGGDNYAATVTISPGPPGGPDPGVPPNGTAPILASDFMPMRLAPNGQLFTTLCDVFFIQQPQDQTNYIGATVTFSAQVDGTPPYVFQWRSNGVVIPGATNLSYTTAPLSIANEGNSYTLTVSNDFSGASSFPALVHVLHNPRLLSCTTRNDPAHLYLKFNKPVNIATGTFDILGGSIFVNGVAYGANQTELVLSTDPIPPDSSQVLRVTALQDQELPSHPIAPDPTDCPFTQGPGRFCADFSGGLPPNTFSSGTTPPSVGPEGALHLTDNALTGNANYWTIPAGGEQSFQCFKAQWQTRLNGPIGNAADGFSFNVGRDLGTIFTPEEGAATGLSVTVDTFDNGGGEVGCEIRWNGARLAFTPAGGGTVNGPPELMKTQFVDASVDVTTTGFVTFRYDNFVATAQIPGYTGISANMYVFAARTGGSAEDCWIDNVCINDITLGPVTVAVLPVNPTVNECSPVTFTSTVTGSPCLNYQWRRNGVSIPGATGPSYTTPSLTCPASQGVVYSLIVSNDFSSAAAASTVTLVCGSTLIDTQPQSQTVPAGTTVTLTVATCGSGPFRFQWRRNGENIPGATNSTYTLLNAQPKDGGSYNVVVIRPGRLQASAQADVVVLSPDTVTLTDNLGAGPSDSRSNGVANANNLAATRQPSEPLHAGKNGGSSVWFEWIAPFDGIATFTTRGSTFDTLLAAYTGPDILSIIEVASNDDDDSRSFSSTIRFNAIAGTAYHIAVDGLAAARGNIVFCWRLDATSALLPRFLTQPASKSVLRGINTSLTVSVINATSLQWYFNGVRIPGATNPTLPILNVQRTSVGQYTVVATNATSSGPSPQLDLSARSLPGILEIGPATTIVTQDKLEDLGPPGPGAFAPDGKTPPHKSASIPVAAGSIGTQILNNYNSTTQKGETNHCGTLGGSTRWIGLTTTQPGLNFFVDTSGSSIPALLAVYNASNVLSPLFIDCSTGVNAQVTFPAAANVDHLVAVDGDGGAENIIHLNWCLGLAPTITSQPSNQSVLPGGSATFTVVATGVPAVGYRWQSNGVFLAGATGASLVINPASNSASYRVVITNLCGWVTSQVAQLSVALPFSLGAEAYDTNRMRLIGPTNPAYTNLPYVIEASTTLTNWSPIYTNGNPLILLKYADPNLTNYPYRFYRAKPWLP